MSMEIKKITDPAFRKYGRIIEVEIDDIKVSEKVEAGSFCLSLSPHKAGGPYILTVTEKDEEGAAQEAVSSNDNASDPEAPASEGENISEDQESRDFYY